jgi:PhnB protein
MTCQPREPEVRHVWVRGHSDFAHNATAPSWTALVLVVPFPEAIPDGRLMSVQLRIGDGLLHLADEFPEMGVLAPPSIGGTPVVLALDVADAEAMFAQAVAAGAQIRQPLAYMFWGDRHGQLEDPFGHRWNIAQHVRDVPHDEVVAAAAQAFT